MKNLIRISVLVCAAFVNSCSDPDQTTVNLSTLSSVSVGTLHSCGVLNGVVKCWGSNAFGQLGNNSTVDSSIPVVPYNLAPRNMAVFASNSHSCSLIAGGVKCWGNNFVGQLGNGGASTTLALFPQDTQIGAGSAASRLFGGNDYTCTQIPTNNAFRCWGSNIQGQFANGATAVSVPAPTNTSLASTGVLSIATGYQHACANPLGSISCWGLNNSGQVGDGTSASPRPSPTTVPGFGSKSEVQMVAAGRDHSCALVQGAVYCWGNNDSGQLGDGTTAGHVVPAVVQGVIANSVLSLVAGNKSTCVITKSSSAMCWGLNDRSQLGDGTTTNRLVPTQVSGLTSGVIAIAAAFEGHACALTGSGFMCWGTNSNGQLGNGSLVNSSTPVAVSF